jgi:hypothetical protein
MTSREQRFELGGVWARKTAIGTVLSGRLLTLRMEEAGRVARDNWKSTRVEIVLFPNRNRRSDRAPDYTAFLVPVREDGREEIEA